MCENRYIRRCPPKRRGGGEKKKGEGGEVGIFSGSGSSSSSLSRWQARPPANSGERISCTTAATIIFILFPLFFYHPSPIIATTNISFDHLLQAPAAPQPPAPTPASPSPAATASYSNNRRSSNFFNHRSNLQRPPTPTSPPCSGINHDGGAVIGDRR
jgi:hypothetical protein